MKVIYDMFNSIISLLKTFSFADLLDIIIIAFIIYNVIKFIRETRAGQLVKGILVLIILYIASYKLNFKMLSGLLNNFFQFSIIALLVVFQPELRRALEQLGRSTAVNFSGAQISGFESQIEKNRDCIDNIIDTCMLFSQTRTGALIVFECKTKLGDIINTGTIVNAQASVPLVGNIFFNKAPLHDGAMIIRDGSIYAAGCILPLTKNENVSLELGTRHRAAIGISEISDAISVVVSEETGEISITENGVIKRDLEKDQLKQILYNKILNDYNSRKSKKQMIISMSSKIKNVKRRKKHKNEKQN